MAPGFDPYHKWLGIPPSEQPPHAYRLLGISLFEADPEVISAASDQRMAHVRTYHLGEHAVQSQALLNEIAAARLLLLNPRKKAEYDLRLRGVPPKPVRASSPATNYSPSPPTLPHRTLDWKLPVSLALAGMMVVGAGVLIYLRQDTVAPETALQQIHPSVSSSSDTTELSPLAKKPSVVSKLPPAQAEKSTKQEPSRPVQEPSRPVLEENAPSPAAESIVLEEQKTSVSNQDPSEPKPKPMMSEQETLPCPQAPSPAMVKTAPSVSRRMELSEVVEQVESALVLIETNRGLGSGFVVESRGTVVTNYHVIDGADWAHVTFENGLSARVEGFTALDRGRDLALLRIHVKTSLATVALRKDLPRKGESVAAFGSPRGFSGTVSEGNVSAIRTGREISKVISSKLYEKILSYAPEADWIQTTAPISKGNSGGPLIDMQGRVVGVNSWNWPEGQNLNFASASPAIIELLKKAHGEPQPLASLEPPKSKATPSHYRPHPGRPPRQQPKPSGPPRFATISLPSGSSLAATMPEVPKGWQSRLFPDDAPVYVAKYSNGDVRGVHTFERGKLHGPTALLGPDGKLRLLTNYYAALRDGKVRAWDYRGQRLVYAEYSRGNKDGLFCLFQDHLPRMIQEWDKGTQLTAYLVEFREGKPTITSEEKLAQEQLRVFTQACEKADASEQEMEEIETELKRELVAWYRDKAEQIRRKRAAALSAKKRHSMTKRIGARQSADAAARSGFWRAALGRSGF